MNCNHIGLSARLLSVAVVFLVISAARSAPAVTTPPQTLPILASHKALYSVSLTSTRPGSDYSDVSGKMALEFNDRCNVWTTSQKSLLRTVSGDGTEETSNNDFRSSESKTGDLYTFFVRQTQNGDVSEFRGSATRNGPDGAGVADYSQPDRKSYKLPAHFVFQTAQQVQLIEYAKRGGRFLAGEMFDGSEGGGAARFNAIILKPDPQTAKPTIKSPLLDSPGYRVRVAFYPADGTGGADAEHAETAVADAEQPEYEMTMTLHDNGVVSDYDYDYEDFSVHGKLEAIQALPRPHC
jgi:hypothetical protein